MSDERFGIVNALLLVVGLTVGVVLGWCWNTDLAAIRPLPTPTPVAPLVKPVPAAITQWLTTGDPRISLGLRDDGSVTWTRGRPKIGDAPPVGLLPEGLLK